MSETATVSPPGQAETFIPPSVVQAALRADAAIRAMAAAREAQANPNSASPAGGQGDAEASAGSGVPAEAQAGGVGMQPQQGSDDPSLAAPPVAADSIAALRADIARLTQEVNTWRGRHQAELPRERAAREAAEDRLRALEAEHAAALEAARAPSSPPPSPLTDEERDTYGADLFDMMERHMAPIINRAVEQALAGFKAKVTNLDTEVQHFQQATARTAQERFFDRLDKSTPNWREIDNDPAFITWLTDEDPMFGVPRKNALDSATRNLNDGHVSKIIRAFLDQRGAGGSQGTGSAPEAPAAGTGAPNNGPTAPPLAPGTQSLDAFAAPGKPTASQGTESGPPGQRIWSISEVTEFYADRQYGRYRGDLAEADRIDREIAAAQRDGRIRQ